MPKTPPAAETFALNLGQRQVQFSEMHNLRCLNIMFKRQVYVCIPAVRLEEAPPHVSERAPWGVGAVYSRLAIGRCCSLGMIACQFL